DLICASPIAFSRLRRAKRAAALLPLAIALAVPLAALTALSPVAGLAAAAGCAAAATAGALINDWRQSPAKRSDFRRRRSGAVMLGLAEAMVGMLIAATAGLAAWPSVFAIAPAVLAILALLALYRSPAAVERTASAA